MTRLLRRMLFFILRRPVICAAAVLLACCSAVIMAKADFRNDIATMLPDGSQSQRTLRKVNASSMFNKAMLLFTAKEPGAFSSEKFASSLDTLASELSSKSEIVRVDHRLFSSREGLGTRPCPLCGAVVNSGSAGRPGRAAAQSHARTLYDPVNRKNCPAERGPRRDIPCRIQ